MYLLAFAYENARLNGSGGFSLNKGKRYIAKWTLLDAGERNRELLQLIVASYNGALLMDRLPHAINRLCSAERGSFLAAHLRVLHEGTEVRPPHR